MWGNHRVEAGGAGGERMDLKQKKERSVLNTPHGSSREQPAGRQRRGLPARGSGCGAAFKGEGEEVSDVRNSPSFGNCAWL